ncbi:hypothetical protein NDU88_005969 [Pleurodeles waltl]|uniref:Uncharacterized protein n=1 Tax=Pleurodeles waltl TaxID=8319 RepID=A0AAV7W9G5_PLEWA|nr:hypothetical protein NDU88_005969 [Pleurodeles waltl]
MDVLNRGNILKLQGQTPGPAYISDMIESIEFIERGPANANKSTKVTLQSVTLAGAVLKESKHFKKWGIILEGAEDPSYRKCTERQKEGVCGSSGSERSALGTKFLKLRKVCSPTHQAPNQKDSHERDDWECVARILKQMQITN